MFLCKGAGMALWWLHSPPISVARIRATSGLSFVRSLLCSERLFSGFSGFPLSSKINISKFQFDRMQNLPENHFRVSGASWVNIHNNNYYYFSPQVNLKMMRKVRAYFATFIEIGMRLISWNPGHNWIVPIKTWQLTPVIVLYRSWMTATWTLITGN